VQGNFGDYRLLRIPDAPAVDVHIVETAKRRRALARSRFRLAPERWLTRSSRPQGSAFEDCQSA